MTTKGIKHNSLGWTLFLTFCQQSLKGVTVGGPYPGNQDIYLLYYQPSYDVTQQFIPHARELEEFSSGESKTWNQKQTPTVFLGWTWLYTGALAISHAISALHYLFFK